MTNEKFQEQIETVTKFVQIYCDSHHDCTKNKSSLKANYKGINYTVEYSICDDCERLLLYAKDKLLACPHDIKPSCRKCPHICYEKNELKQMVKIMRSSGMKLGLIKLKKFIGISN